MRLNDYVSKQACRITKNFAKRYLSLFLFFFRKHRSKYNIVIRKSDIKDKHHLYSGSTANLVENKFSLNNYLPQSLQ